MNIQQLIYPSNQTQQDQREEWLSHLTYANPVGVNRILWKFGFSGMNQPNNREETIEAMEMMIEQNGTDAIRELLAIMPEFEAIREMLTPKAKIVYAYPVNEPEYKPATGNEILNIPVDHIVKGALIFGLVYLLSKKL